MGPTGRPWARRRLRPLTRRLTFPVRHAAIPVLGGNGRGLRVQFGESAIRLGLGSRGELAVERALLDLLSPGDVFYDVGANIGWYSLLAARAVGPRGRVLAFEPSFENALCAQRNARRNGLANISVVAVALTDQDGWMTFLEKGSLEGRLDKDDCEAQAERRAKRAAEIKGRALVPIATLDRWLAGSGAPAPNVVKIDVEGAETGVLRGMRRTLTSIRPALIIELHGTGREVADELDRAGYEHHAIEIDAGTREAPWWVHIMATPIRANRERMSSPHAEQAPAVSRTSVP